jgi:hypothetical protein
MLVRGNIWNRILCHWQVRWLTPEQWAAIPTITPAVIATLVCVGTPPPSHAIVPPPPIPPVAWTPPPGAPFTQLPPAWTTYVPPSAWIPPAGFVPFENGGGDVAGGVAPVRGRLDDVGPSGGPVVEHQSPVVTPPTDQRVPEPGSLALLAGAVVAMLWGRR